MFVQSVVRARSEVEAAWLMYESKPGTRIIAGGTDLMLQLWRGQRQASSLIDLRRSAMDHILETDASIRIGSTTSVAAIARHPGIRRHCADLHHAAATFASLQIRNMATVGGNVGNASPAADLVPSLMSHGAKVHVRSGDAQRVIPLGELYTGPGQHVLTPKELITAIELAKPAEAPGRVHHRFLKLGFRGAQIIAVVNLAVGLRVHRGVVEEARLAFGAVAPTVVRATGAEAALRGVSLDRDNIARAATAALDDISPIDDPRATASYRRRVARNYVRLALEEIAAGEAQEA